MSSKNARVVAFTGVMIALAVLFQSLRLIFPGLTLMNLGGFNLMQLLIGTLVNLCLLVTTWNVGIASGILLSVLTPVVAFMQGQMPIPHMIAVVALGNAVYCLIARIPLTRAGMRFVLSMLAAAAKFGLMATLVLRLVVPVLLPSAVLDTAKVEKIAAALSAGFVWTQLITAVIGAVLACAISPRLPKASQ